MLAPGWLGHFIFNEYYKTEEEFLFALADALREEYRAVVAAGFVLQIDDPGLPDWWDMLKPEPTIEAYRKFARLRIDAVNHALVGIPEEKVRYHLCWGSWHGPHTHDLPLEHILEVKAQTYSFEAGNVRHEHEWRVWQQAKLPPGKMLMPGVVSHATNLVEHPQLVADRILRYAPIVDRENIVAGTDCGPSPRGPCLGQAAHACRRGPPFVDVPLALVKHARGRQRIPSSGGRVATARLQAMSQTACRHAPGSVRRGDGAALRCRHGSADRWGTPGKVPVESCL